MSEMQFLKAITMFLPPANAKGSIHADYCCRVVEADRLLAERGIWIRNSGCGNGPNAPYYTAHRQCWGRVEEVLQGGEFHCIPHTQHAFPDADTARISALESAGAGEERK